MANGNDSTKARKGKAKSPWSRGPNCETLNAKQSHNKYVARGNARPASTRRRNVSDKLPALPERVSPDGREVWDWAVAFSRAVHDQARERELGQRIRSIGTRCGDCHLWMKRDECPREKGVMVGGPTSGDRICTKFTESASAGQLREKLQAELVALSGSPTQ